MDRLAGKDALIRDIQIFYEAIAIPEINDRYGAGVRKLIFEALPSSSSRRRKRRSSQAEYEVAVELEFEINDINNPQLSSNFVGEIDDLGDTISKEHFIHF